MKYNLLILFMIALKCGADDEPTTVNYYAVENVTNSEVFSASTAEGNLTNISSSSEPNGSENTLINATDDNAGEVKKKEFDLSGRLAQQGTRMVKNIVGGLVKGFTQQNEPDSKEDAGDNEEPTTVNYSTIENVTNSEVSTASTTEAPINSTSEPPGAVNTLINATNVKADSPFRKKELGKLPLPRKLPGQRTRLVTNIIGSLMKGLAQLKEPDSEEDDEEPTTVNYSTVENVTNWEASDASTTEAPDNRFDKCTQLLNISSSTESPAIENTLINPIDNDAVGPSKKKGFGKLLLPGTQPQQGTRVVTNIIGSLWKGLAA